MKICTNYRDFLTIRVKKARSGFGSDIIISDTTWPKIFGSDLIQINKTLECTGKYWKTGFSCEPHCGQLASPHPHPLPLGQLTQGYPVQHNYLHLSSLSGTKVVLFSYPLISCTTQLASRSLYYLELTTYGSASPVISCTVSLAVTNIRNSIPY